MGQALLGAATIWSNKAADIATAHVMVGALALALGALLSVMTWQERRFPNRLASTSQWERAPISSKPIASRFGNRRSELKCALTNGNS